MIYDGDNPISRLVNAEYLSWQPGQFSVKPRQVCALAFRLEGSADMLCAGKRYFIQAGDILYMPQGLGYEVSYSETQMIAFHFVTQRDDPAPQVFSVQDRSRVHGLFMKAAELWKQKEPGYTDFCMAALYEVLGVLCREQHTVELPAHFQKAVTYIHGHFRESLTISSLCRKAHISPTAFRKCFDTYYHTTPTAYVRQLRLEYARNLIAGGMPVEQAAMECGIPDSKYFARLVKRTYGCTPRQLYLHGK